MLYQKKSFPSFYIDSLTNKPPNIGIMNRFLLLFKVVPLVSNRMKELIFCLVSPSLRIIWQNYCRYFFFVFVNVCLEKIKDKYTFFGKAVITHGMLITWVLWKTPSTLLCNVSFLIQAFTQSVNICRRETVIVQANVPWLPSGRHFEYANIAWKTVSFK